VRINKFLIKPPNQVMATKVGDKAKTSLDMIYVGLEDGRFMGYFSTTSYTTRAASGSAADLPWAPYDIETVNGVCTTPSACTGIATKTCTAAPAASQSAADACAAADLTGDPAADAWGNAQTGQQNCAGAAQECTYSLYGGRKYSGKIVATACPASDRDAGGSCTAACCDRDIRNYYTTSAASGGAV
jgi:hypothetical protein